jgi:general secretion pathway protein B
MSFILDALRKSEQERQRQAGPGFAELRPAMARPVFPVWAVALGALLAINLVVLVVVMMRREDGAVVTPPPSPGTASPAPSAQATNTAPYSKPSNAPDLAAPVPLRTEMPSDLYAPGADESPRRTRHDDARVPLEESLPEAEPELQPPPRGTPTDGESDPELPTINDVTLQGANLPELHLDIHVYAAQPAERFVFLNNRKYREGDETPEGTKIERIARDGVVLNHRGVRFLLPRQ